MAIALVAFVFSGLSPGRAAADLLATGDTDQPVDGSSSIQAGATPIESQDPTGTNGNLTVTLYSAVYQGLSTNPFVAGGVQETVNGPENFGPGVAGI